MIKKASMYSKIAALASARVLKRHWCTSSFFTEPPPTKVEGFSGLERLRRTVGSFPTEVGGFKPDFRKMKDVVQRFSKHHLTLILRGFCTKFADLPKSFELIPIPRNSDSAGIPKSVIL